MSIQRIEGFLDSDYDQASIHPEILSAVKSLRSSGVETIASQSGIGQIGVSDTWGSYIQIRLFYKDGFTTARKISTFAQALSAGLQQDFDNPGLALQLVSTEEWKKDPNTLSMETRVPIYRLQLVGQKTDDQIRHAWNRVAQEFSPLVIK